MWPQRKVKTSTLAVPTVLKNIYLFHFLLTSRHPLFWFVVYFLLHLGCLETLPGDHFRSAMLFQTSTYSKQFPVEYIVSVTGSTCVQLSDCASCECPGGR